MSRIQLRSGDVALLGRLNRAPLEIGNIPVETVERLSASGLIRKVLGCCEITRAGQLAYQRHQFLRASGRRIARVTRRNPIFLQEARFGAPASRSRLASIVEKRRSSTALNIRFSFIPDWLMRLAAGRFGTEREAIQTVSGAATDTTS